MQLRIVSMRAGNNSSSEIPLESSKRYVFVEIDGVGIRDMLYNSPTCDGNFISIRGKISRLHVYQMELSIFMSTYLQFKLVST